LCNKGSVKTILLKQNQNFASSDKSTANISDFIQASVRMQSFLNSSPPLDNCALAVEKL